ncbi:hypothetical protein FY557_11340 [Chryseobacterium sp. SN22]|uniref:DUF6438 domain-containing protein n=1 Tax=Chryseobacterium sp. SN22 TaxID=2606431 RepID=UPI0011ED38C2|nr:DUF6438 domain-containing protein [Chryseobacterium sp. SN22]KAA0127749.1 hypothetical protein FY557_11340 [Chryseobacterium sp. SN22]
MIIKIDGKDYLKVITEETEENLYSERYVTTHMLVSKILDYQFDGLVEYNPNPSHHSIQKIEFRTDMCYGTCPVFTLKLDKSGLSKFIAENYNFFKRDDPDFEKKSHKAFKKGEGTFETGIKKADSKSGKSVELPQFYRIERALCCKLDRQSNRKFSHHI